MYPRRFIVAEVVAPVEDKERRDMLPMYLQVVVEDGQHALIAHHVSHHSGLPDPERGTVVPLPSEAVLMLLTTLRGVVYATRRERSTVAPPAPISAGQHDPACPECRGTGWIITDMAVDTPWITCPACQQAADAA